MLMNINDTSLWWMSIFNMFLKCDFSSFIPVNAFSKFQYSKRNKTVIKELWGIQKV